jgi:dUTP pyrophosphatase
MIEKLELKIKRISDSYADVPLPAYATPEAAGMDIRAAIDDEYILRPGEYSMISTNISVEIPKGYEIQVRPRSGLAAKHGVTILNVPGTIDSDYRGEIKVILINHGKEPFTIKKGERIAQLVLSKIYHASLVEVDDLTETQRSAGGFGHTGRT